MDLLKGQTYILGVVGNGVVSRTIQDFSDCKIPFRERWSHVAGLFWHWTYNCWCVVESHSDTGVKLRTLTDWISINISKPIIQCFQYHFSPRLILSYLGKPYAFIKIAQFARDVVIPFPSVLPDSKIGVFCSELLALCDNEIITKELNKDAKTIRPVDFQLKGQGDNLIFDIINYLHTDSVHDICV